MDVGAGTGRFCVSLLEAGAAEVVAVEPSQAVDVIRRDLGKDPRVTILNVTGDQIPPDVSADFAISLGVLHHIPEPEPVVRAVYNALKPGGKFIVWLYGSEGIKSYLRLVNGLRALTKKIPDAALEKVVAGIDAVLVVYMKACRRVPLPLHDYLNNVLSKFPKANRRVVIYDQLRPNYAKYYTRPEAQQLLESAPFSVEVHDRRGYSWIAIGTKQESAVGNRAIPELGTDSI
jgi:SAM-dependent methyltransferase